MINKYSLWEEQMDLLAQQDFILIDDFLSREELNNVQSFFDQKIRENELEKAAIGATGEEKIIETIRGDYTYWLDKQRDQVQIPIFDALDEMKLLLNRSFFLSLSDYEFHLALYPEGTFYKKHLDQFQGRNNRMISMIIYLNENWKVGDGGELRIYKNDGSVLDVQPVENRCVLFRSDVLYHEVLKAHKERKSLTGWMLYQPSPLAAIPGV